MATPARDAPIDLTVWGGRALFGTGDGVARGMGASVASRGWCKRRLTQAPVRHPTRRV
jgi:hypothetical protein